MQSSVFRATMEDYQTTLSGPPGTWHVDGAGNLCTMIQIVTCIMLSTIWRLWAQHLHHEQTSCDAPSPVPCRATICCARVVLDARQRRIWVRASVCFCAVSGPTPEMDGGLHHSLPTDANRFSDSSSQMKLSRRPRWIDFILYYHLVCQFHTSNARLSIFGFLFFALYFW